MQPLVIRRKMKKSDRLNFADCTGATPIFREEWSLSAWKLLPTRQLAAKASHPMSPSYSGKLLMIAFRDSSTILYKYTRTRVRSYVTPSYVRISGRIYVCTSNDNCPRLRFVIFARIEATSTKCAWETRWMSAPSVQLLKETPDTGCFLQSTVTLSYWTISLSLSSSLRRSFLSL